MPKSWKSVKSVKSVDLYKISLKGLEQINSGKKIENGRLMLSLDKGEAISIVPNGFSPNTDKFSVN